MGIIIGFIKLRGMLWVMMLSRLSLFSFVMGRCPKAGILPQLPLSQKYIVLLIQVILDQSLVVKLFINVSPS